MKIFKTGILCAFSLLVLGVQAEFIPSDWTMAEPEKTPVSAQELANREARIKAIQAQKEAAQRKMTATRELIKAKRKNLLQCLKDKGVILYSVEDCPACKEQRAYFGDDFAELDYVNCAQAKFTCPLNGITGYPTWYLGSRLGIKKKGVKDLPTLARLAGCPWSN